MRVGINGGARKTDDTGNASQHNLEDDSTKTTNPQDATGGPAAGKVVDGTGASTTTSPKNDASDTANPQDGDGKTDASGSGTVTANPQGADSKTDTPAEAVEGEDKWGFVKELAGSVAVAGAGAAAANMFMGSGSSEPAASGAGGAGGASGNPQDGMGVGASGNPQGGMGGGASGNPQDGMGGGASGNAQGGMGGGVGNGIGAPKNFLNSPNTGGIPTGNINMNMPASGGGHANFSSTIPSADSMFNMSGDHNRQLISAPISTPNNGMMDMGMGGIGGIGGMGAMSMMGSMGSMGMMPFGMM